MSKVTSTSEAEFSPQVYARLAGFLYLIVIAGGSIAELIVRQQVVVPNDAAATATNILAHGQLFRWGFAADLIAGLCVMTLIMLFYSHWWDVPSNQPRCSVISRP